ncbi:MAG: hypothetical protein J6K43_16475 [Lachnospiraceae bacterium]|nr:hypothetical protein [Lachnospiraceae bacterium]
MKKNVINIIIGVLFYGISNAVLIYFMNWIVEIRIREAIIYTGIVAMLIYILFCGMSIGLFRSNAKQFFGGSISSTIISAALWTMLEGFFDVNASICGLGEMLLVLTISIGGGSLCIGLFYFLRYLIYKKQSDYGKKFKKEATKLEKVSVKKYIINIIIGIAFSILTWLLFLWMQDKFYPSFVNYIELYFIISSIMLLIYILCAGVSIRLFQSTMKQFLGGSIPSAFLTIIPCFCVGYCIDGLGAIFGAILWNMVLTLSIGLGSFCIGIWYIIRHLIQKMKINISAENDKNKKEILNNKE